MKEEVAYSNALLKVSNCFDSSETLEKLETSRKLMMNFFKLYSPSNNVIIIFGIQYEEKLRELNRGIE